MSQQKEQLIATNLAAGDFTSSDSSKSLDGDASSKFQQYSRSQQETKSWKALSTVIGGFIWMLYSGSMYVTGSIVDYIGAYYNVTSEQTSYVLPLILTLNCIFVAATSKLVPVVNPKYIIAAGGTIGVSLLVLSSFMKSFIGWMIFYVLSFSIANGTTYIVPIHHGWLWYPGKPGLISGVILAGYGFACLIFNNVALKVVNPENEPEIDQEIADRVPTMLRTLAGFYAIIVMIAVAMIWRGPEPPIEINEFTDNETPIILAEDEDLANSIEPLETKRQTAKDEGFVIIDYVKNSFLSRDTFVTAQQSVLKSTRSIVTTMVSRKEDKVAYEQVDQTRFIQALKSKQFWLIYLMMSLSVITGFYTLDIYKLMGEANGISIEFLTEVGAISGLFGAARFIWSAALDRYSFRLVYGSLLCLQIVLATTFDWARQNEWLYSIYVCLITWCEGGHFVLGPTILKKIFAEQATRLLGILFTYTGILSLAMIGLLASPIGDDYVIFYLACACLNLGSLAVLVLMFSELPFKFR